MNLGYLRYPGSQERRPASREEIKARICQYRAWKILCSEEYPDPDRWSIEVTKSDDGGWHTTLYCNGELMAEQREIWYPTPGILLRLYDGSK